MSSTDELTAKALKAWRFMYRRGFIEGFGHIAFRVPGADQFFLTRHSLALEAEPEDFLLVDMKGRKLAGRGDMPGEFPIHLEIFRARPDVNSITHYHGMYSTAFTTSGRTLGPIHLMGTLFHDGVPTYPDPRLVSTTERGEAVAKSLGTHRAVLLYAHGAVITGASIEETVGGAFLFEENAHRAVVSATLGAVNYIGDKMAHDAGEELLKSRGPFRRVWAMVEAEGQYKKLL